MSPTAAPTPSSWGLADDEQDGRYPTGPRWTTEPEIWGAKEAAHEIGVAPQNLRQVRDLPEPFDEIAASTLWRADEIRRFARKRNARLGRAA